MHKLITATLLAMTLAGCATTPAPAPTKTVAEMTDAELCAEGGRSEYLGDAARFEQAVAEGSARIKAHRMTLDAQTCQSYATAGAYIAEAVKGR